MKDDVMPFFESFFSGNSEFIPRLLTTLLVAVIGYLLGRLIQRLVRRFILYLNERMNQQLQSRMLNVDLKSSAVFISKTLFWIIITITILVCIQLLQLNFLSAWFDRIMGYLPNILASVVIVFVGIISGRLLGDLIESAASRTGLTNGKPLGRAVRYLILFVAVVIAADQLGIDIGFLTNLTIIILAALLFGAALAFGLGAKTSVSNILGSYYVRKSHQLGTRIRMDKVEGTIVKITDRSVFLETEEGLMEIPSKDFNEHTITIVRKQDE